MVKDHPEYVLVTALPQLGVGQVLHDEVAEALLGVEVERLVLDDVFVLELLDIEEVGFNRSIMLVLHVQYLHREHLPALFVHALADDAVCALPDLLLHPEAFLEGVLSQAELQFPGLALIQGVMGSHIDVVSLELGGAV